MSPMVWCRWTKPKIIPGRYRIYTQVKYLDLFSSDSVSNPAFLQAKFDSFWEAKDLKNSKPPIVGPYCFLKSISKMFITHFVFLHKRTHTRFFFHFELSLLWPVLIHVILELSKKSTDFFNDSNNSYHSHVPN